jgi:hypothetical protein
MLLEDLWEAVEQYFPYSCPFTVNRSGKEMICGAGVSNTGQHVLGVNGPCT